MVLRSASVSFIPAQGTTKLTHCLHRCPIIMDYWIENVVVTSQTLLMDHGTPSYLPHLHACRVFIGPVIGRILQQMPSLSKLSPCAGIGVVHGPSWTFPQLALSLPRLRQFEMTGLTFCPVVLPNQTLEVEDGNCAALATFRYEAIPTRDRKYALSEERDALSLVLEMIHHSLATLALPSEPAPIPLIFQRDWPNPH